MIKERIVLDAWCGIPRRYQSVMRRLRIERKIVEKNIDEGKGK